MEFSDWSALYGLLAFISGFIAISISVYLSPYWKNTSARLLMLLMVSAMIWSLAYGMELISPNQAIKLWWVKIEYFGAAWVGMLLFCFVISIVWKKWQINKTGYFLLSTIPILTIILVLTNNNHHLMWQLAWLDLSGNAPALAYTRGLGFWGYVIFAYIFLFIATIIIIQSLIFARGIFQKQLFTILIGMIFPWIANFLYLFGPGEFKLFDLTPASFTISGLTFSWGLLKYQMLSLIPLAREAVISSIDDPIIALDNCDRVLDMNKPAKNLFEVDHFVPAHNRLEKLIPIVYEQMSMLQKNNQSETETSFKVQALEKHWNFKIAPLLNKNNATTGRMIILRDITERKNAENAVKASEKINRIMLEASPNPIVYYNEKGEVTYINPSFTRVFGWELNELFGKKIDFVPQENMQETLKALQATRDYPEGNYDFITRRYTKSGDILDVSINSALYRAEKENNTNMVVNITDITKIKKTERELRNTQNFIRSIIDSMPSILVGVNSEGIITHWNIEAENLTGVITSQAEGQLLKDIFPQLSRHISNVDTIIREQKVKKESKATLHIAGKNILADITIYPIQSDTIEGAVIRVDDISERIKIDEMMVQSEKMMSVGGLAAGMAHEINNPLAGILQNTQVVINRLSKDLPINVKTAEECGIKIDDIKSYMEKRKILSMMDHVRVSGEQAAKIVSNMLSFSRKSNHRKSRHYLRDIMEATIELVNNDYSMKKKYDFRAIEIQTDYQSNTPSVPCERNEIQQVFLNIIKNGAEAMADDGINSPKFFIKEYSLNDMVVFEIKDNGPGIDMKTKKRIFEPFFTTKDVGIGTGLGLSVSYFIITENHNGVLSVDSRLGKGTKFILKLPIEQQKNILKK